MKYRYSFLIFFFAAFVQGTVLNLFAIFGTTPDLILCLVAAFALFYEKQFHAALFGTLAGLFLDICYMQYTGISALGYLLTALGIMAAGTWVNRENRMTILLLTVLATVFYQCYLFGMYHFFGSSIVFSAVLRKSALLIVYNAAVALLLYRIFIGRVERFRSDRFYK